MNLPGTKPSPYTTYVVVKAQTIVSLALRLPNESIVFKLSRFSIADESVLQTIFSDL